MSEQQQEPIFSIEKVYAKDISMEIPNAPQVFLERENPGIEMQLQTEAANIDEGLYEVVVTVTVTAKLAEKVMFLVEVAQAGIFQLRNLPTDNIEPILGVACPNIVFPYLRETVSDLITRAGFPPVLLAPINFEAMYAQRLQAQEQAQQGQATGAIPIQ